MAGPIWSNIFGAWICHSFALAMIELGGLMKVWRITGDQGVEDCTCLAMWGRVGAPMINRPAMCAICNVECVQCAMCKVQGARCNMQFVICNLCTYDQEISNTTTSSRMRYPWQRFRIGPYPWSLLQLEPDTMKMARMARMTKMTRIQYIFVFSCAPAILHHGALGLARLPWAASSGLRDPHGKARKGVTPY